MHFVLKDKDILVTPFQSVPAELCRLSVTGLPPQHDTLKRSEPNIKCPD